MATPAYNPLGSTNLSSSTAGTTVPVNAQSNDNALADELSQFGMLGWAQTVTYSGSQIASIVASQGVFRTRIDFTYVASGPATGKVNTETHYWSNDSGSTWALRTNSGLSVTNGLLTYSYDGSGNCTGATWS